jgi:hypothetical protein
MVHFAVGIYSQIKGLFMKSLVIALTMLMSVSALAQRNGHGNRNQNRNVYDNPRYPTRGMQQERLVLQIGEHLRGQNIIKLKQELKMQYPGINPKMLKLKAVKLVAKSKQGRGKATLVVGQDQSYQEIIGGDPYDFHDNSGYTFDKIKMFNPSYDSQGKWQVHLKGNIKVKKVVLIVKKKMQQQRAQNIKIHMYGEHLRGQNVLKIKQLLKQQTGMMNLQGVQIKKVTLIAKSKKGRGQATLVVGQSAEYPETIGGNPRAFQSVSPRSYDRVTLVNTTGSSQGKVQVELQGNIKVKEIIVTIVKKNSRGGMYNY